MVRFAEWGSRLDGFSIDASAKEVAEEMGEWLIDYMRCVGFSL